jgi:HEAT repeat protein
MRRLVFSFALLMAGLSAAAKEPEGTSPSSMPATPVELLPELVRSLDHGGWNDRIHAVQRLGAMGPAARDALSLALDDGDWQVRMTAVHWLGRMGVGSLEPLSRAMETDPCLVVRMTALHWLGSLGPEALPALVQAEQNDSVYMRLEGRYWQKKIDPGSESDREAGDMALMNEGTGQKDNACVNQPKPGLLPGRHRQKPDPPPAQDALETEVVPIPALEPELPPPAALPKRVERHDAGEDHPPKPEERYAELDALLWDKEDLPPAGQVAKRGDAPYDPSAAALQEKERSQELLEPLLGGKESLDEEARSEKRGAMSVSGSTVVVAASHKADDPGLALLGRREDRLAYGRYPTAPREPKYEPPLELMESIKGKVPRDALPVLLSALKHPDSRYRAWAADELGKMGADAETAVAPLSSALADTSPRVRASAALALGNIGPQSDGAVPALVNLLRDRSADVRYGAVVGLYRIGTPRARKAFRRHVREEARRAIEGGG